jgi:predicted nucleotidyltransferase
VPGGEGSSVESRKEAIIGDLCRQAESDESVLAAILIGSVPKKHDDQESDIDLELVVTPRGYEELVEAGRRIIHTDEYDIIHTTLARIREVRDSGKDEDHWPYVGCRVLFDKTGTLPGVLEEVARYDDGTRVERLKEHYLGYWGNMLGAISCIRRGKQWEARIYGALSIDSLIRLVCNLNHAWAPETKWAKEELRCLEVKPDRFEERINQILTDPNIAMMSGLWEDIARFLRHEGCGWVDHPEQIL